MTDQEIANLVLMSQFILLPIALGLMLFGRSRGNRRVLAWSRGLAILALVLAAAYDVAGAVYLLLAEPEPGHEPWADPSAVVDYPTFFLPIGVGALLAGAGILVGVTRARHHLG
ncbi:hypothetical protein [Kribbella sindirgiensis]|uniref:Uncharacterized protein n=1 Tax=Kribbella sindirgiensis TaxID=1124744 RepID=A0A4V2M1K5_9ACTN|nr:hypothetical protein [Kribbella sindirgiensis]TCC17217.1 hypothetical protein E0H50_39460 [Kribbella sindirgiensis]